jgi:aspartate racemase
MNLSSALKEVSLRSQTLGIIGGIGPESTIDYYRSIVSAYGEQRNRKYPSILINMLASRRYLVLKEISLCR